MAPLDLIGAGCVFPNPDPSLELAWATALHAVARASNAQVAGHVEPVIVGRSFYPVVLVSTEDAATTLMLNPSNRLVAAVAGERPFVVNAEFVPVPRPEIFVSAGFIVADIGSLVAEVCEADLTQLDDHDAAQVSYHNPRRVGEVIYNWFD